MSRKDTIEEKAWELLLKVCSEQGLVPVDAEYAKTGGEYNLLMYIDKEGGVGIDECEACSRALDPLLDEENFISDPYTLIVSSPGLGRPLKRPRDFLLAAGGNTQICRERERYDRVRRQGVYIWQSGHLFDPPGL